VRKKDPVARVGINRPRAIKLEIFVAEFLKDFNAQDAAKRCGAIGRSSGNILMRDPEVMRMIRERVDQRADRCKVDADYVLSTIKMVVERCQQLTICRTKQGEPIFIVTEEGEKMALVKFDANAVLKGCELLGKHLKMWTEKFELTITDIENLSNEQLEALSRRLFGDSKEGTIQ